MPRFSVRLTDLRIAGPVLDVHIALSLDDEAAYLKRGAVPPRAVAAAALIDTGASITFIRSGIAAHLGLISIGSVPISTASRRKSGATYSKYV